MNEDRLAETLAKIDADMLSADDRSRPIDAGSIRKLHSRRRARERSIVVGSLGLAVVLATVFVRPWSTPEGSNGPVRSAPVVSNEPAGEMPLVETVELNSKPDFELATVADPAMNLELELMRESIAESLVKLARLRKAGGTSESDWRQDLDFVLKNYPGTIAAETARSEFGTGPETTTH